MSPGPNVARVNRAPVPVASDRACVALAHDVARVALVALAEHHLARLELPWHGELRDSARGRSCSSVENTGTRPSSSTTSVERVAAMNREYHTRRNCHRVGQPRRVSCLYAPDSPLQVRHRDPGHLAMCLPAALACGRPARPAPRPRGRLGASVHASCGRRSTSAAPKTSRTSSGSAARCQATASRGRHVHELRLQFLSSTTKHWADLAGTTRAFISVGRGGGRQGGQSFQLKPVAGKPAILLRGLVEFQWRRGKKVAAVHPASNHRGHRSLAGADPPTFSAATCLIG